ncbi:glycogen/starch/alpha-glucan phosphorylase [Texcoconibacillus texcoconensis]|uniref:Alpha-1,4 glucan phosphorylase n=1 Tax=Texcoconibacillus texcoconensis TaxID=1095777 RepID=A0A840QT67_9BACI|nr:glycogen/starch/alpha-glucan phosphorylase [Texcoconibacillus texcoconensis]MBB5174736.1 starch phosphorylase [Texcoconibacillus texcoconensis]
MRNDFETFFQLTKEKLENECQTTVDDCTASDVYYAIASIVKNDLIGDWSKTENETNNKSAKKVCYLSMEFLVGRLIENNLINRGVLNIAKETIQELGFEPEEVFMQEPDAALGNGGLGRLAACFLDSLASLRYPACGYGIRYRYGLFQQRIIQGEQIELPDYWLEQRYPWEERKFEEAVSVHFGGTVRTSTHEDGKLQFDYEHTDEVLAVPYDIPITGFDNEFVNTLRLYSAETPSPLGDPVTCEDVAYYHELGHEHDITQISGYLYPDDSSYEGKRLRLKQQYFLVSASLQNMLRSFKENSQRTLNEFHESFAIQINDTHPSLAIPELMRLLMDQERLSWDEAWKITTQTFAYTNHTTLQEALETWPKEMLESLLPRIYMIIDEINERFCQSLWFDYPELREKIPELAIIADDQVKMAHLALVGSFSVNGVARLHTNILKEQEMKTFYTLFPDRFNNKTNGITHRRWLLQINPSLSSLITDAIGPKWIHEPQALIQLLRYANDAPFLQQMDEVKRENKRLLSEYIYQETGMTVDENSIFDVHVKRLHEYKRQLLNVFHILHLYNELKENPQLDVTPRTFIFGAKAAPNYYLAKEIIKFINVVASIINNDPDVRDKLKVIFLENYNVSVAERIIPATDLSEQISTAGKEASGTGNMKMMMNGAVTIGTLDGANIEIRDLVGDENIFIFGLRAEEVQAYHNNGGYMARDLYNTDPRIKRILDQMHNGTFGREERAFKDLYYNLLYHNDPYFVLKDFDAYIETHELVERAYRNRGEWTQMNVANIAYSGKFSSDRTIQEYASQIWKLKPLL